MKRAALACAASLAVLGTAGAAHAILNGSPDDAAHPYVGLVDVGDTICTGTALSPTVVVTAGHCFDGDDLEATIAFDEDASDVSTITEHPGTATVHPAYAGLGANDVAVLVLDEPVALPRYGDLPTEDSLRRRTPVTVLGYGVQDDGSAYTRQGVEQRLSPANAEGPGVARAQGAGGACFGDSGGPNVATGTDTVLAVNSAVANAKCKGKTFSARLDTAAALAFLAPYLDS